MKNLFLILLCIFFAFPLIAKESITCTQFQICELIKLIDQHKKYELNSPISITGDPHHYDPDLKTIKSLLTANKLISAPIEAHPFIKSILKKRKERNNDETILLDIQKNELIKYQTNNREALSHFWLYPDIYCRIKTELAVKLELPEKKNCSIEKINLSLTETLKMVKHPIILTHDAIEPLLKFYGSHLKIISLKGSGHHDRLSPRTMKELSKILLKGKVIWVLEKNITVPENVLKMIRKNDSTINIDTTQISNEKNEDFHIINNILKEIENANIKS